MSLITFDINKAKSFLAESDHAIESLSKKSKEHTNLSSYENLKTSLGHICYLLYTKGDQEQVRQRIRFYGSRIIGLATDESDLDIFLDFGRKFDVFKTGYERDYSYLEANLNLNTDWRVVETVNKYRYPKIEAIYLPTGLRCR